MPVSSESAPHAVEAVEVDRRSPVAACPVCASRRLHYAFSRNSYRVVRCADCRLMLLNPQPSDAELGAIYSEAYFLDGAGATDDVSEMKAATAREYLTDIARYRGKQGGTLLEVGCGRGELLVEAHRAGYDVTGIEVSAAAAAVARQRTVDQPGATSATVIRGELDSAGLAEGSFDVCVLCDVIEHVRDPRAFLQRIRTLLKPDGTLFIATPSLNSWSARLLRQNWMEFKPEHLTYFDPCTIQNALFQSGFHQAVVRRGWKTLSLEYVAEHFRRFPVPVVSRVVRAAVAWSPSSLRRRKIRVVASGMTVLAGPAPVAATRKLSIVIPAYNEASTVDPLLRAVLAKQVDGLDIEVIVVESNSSDGTRDIVRQFANHPRVRLVLEDRPRGKGHAVRAGIASATGHFVLIQDADLEYDLEDYDVLLDPLLQGREALVLGSRHGGHAWWKMRTFADQPLLSFIFNCGHWFFTTLLNVMFGQRLKDPFTMFKVFRRDCLFGLQFRCNRFDFDYELLIKMVRKGYQPIEIPVNYRSRSYHEGKKVSAFRDPFNWLKALAWLRVTGIDPLREVEKSRKLRAKQETVRSGGSFSRAA